MSEQPEALRLADALDRLEFDEPHGAAAELRRLHCWDRRANVGTPHQGTYYCGEITNMPALADARNALAN